MKTVFLYTTGGCHLCEQAKAIIQACLVPEETLLEREIADSETWMERFATRIPVMEFDGRELGWPFTEHEVMNCLGRQAAK